MHELIHSFTTYIVYIYEKNKKDILFQEEQDFYETAYKLHQEHLNKHKTWDSYLDDLHEFIAKTITPWSQYNGRIYSKEMIDAFRKMYQGNKRKIVSLSKQLRNNLNSI